MAADRQASDFSAGGKAHVILADVAREAGVSRMTVSRVLRNERYTSGEVRARVLAAAEKLGYRPNPMVAALMSYVRGEATHTRNGVIAYLTSSPERHGWRSRAAYLQYFTGAARQAGYRGFRLEEFWLQEKGMTGRRLSQILYSQGILGVIVGPMATSHGHLSLEWRHFCPVAIGHSLLRPSLTRVCHDHYGSIMTALRMLRRRGYRRIGLAMPLADDTRVQHHWSAGYLAFHQHADRGRHPPLFLPRAWKKEALTPWIRRHGIDAVVSTHSEIPETLAKGGLRVPAEVGFAHLDLLENFHGVAGINQQPETIGAAAVDLVASQITHNELGISSNPTTSTLRGVWVEGGTVHPPRP